MSKSWRWKLRFPTVVAIFIILFCTHFAVDVENNDVVTEKKLITMLWLKILTFLFALLREYKLAANG